MIFRYHAPQMANRDYQPEKLAYDPGPFGDDCRLKYMLYYLDVRGLDVLNLGSLEGHQEIVLEKMGARSITGVECRDGNLLKCDTIKKLYKLDRTTFVKADVVDLYGPDGYAYGLCHYDLVVCCGLLYHIPDPPKCLAWCRKRADKLFLGTHYCEGTGQDRFQDKYTGRDMPEGTRAATDGTHGYSFWLDERSLAALLNDSGYSRVHVLGKDVQNQRPHITILAEA